MWTLNLLSYCLKNNNKTPKSGCKFENQVFAACEGHTEGQGKGEQRLCLSPVALAPQQEPAHVCWCLLSRLIADKQRTVGDMAECFVQTL